VTLSLAGGLSPGSTTLSLMAIRVLDESEITAEGRRIQAELIAEGERIIARNRQRRAGQSQDRPIPFGDLSASAPGTRPRAED
jgi:hypothetical protein